MKTKKAGLITKSFSIWFEPIGSPLITNNRLFYFKKSGLKIFALELCWYDPWEKKFILPEISIWRNGNPIWSNNKEWNKDNNKS